MKVITYREAAATAIESETLINVEYITEVEHNQPRNQVTIKTLAKPDGYIYDDVSDLMSFLRNKIIEI